METKFIFINNPYSLNISDMFEDIKRCPNVIYQFPYKRYDTKIRRLFNKLKKLYTRGVYYSNLFSFIKKTCVHDYWLSDMDFDENVQYYVIFVNDVLSDFSIDYIEGLKHHNVVPVLLLINPVSKIRDYVVEKFKSFGDYIFTFDEMDSKKYGYALTHSMYSKICRDIPKDIASDIYFVGAAKDRMYDLIGVYKKLACENVKADFSIINAKANEIQYKSSINYCNFNIPYKTALKETLKANCILEILQKGQAGTTLRYYEAVCYNKKLLTNNKNVVNLPFYNPEYIHVFEKPEDIDCDWVKERIPIDYGYDGRFSPVHLLDRIIELDKKREQESGAK